MFIKAAEDVKRENAEREKRNKEKAAAAAESRRREKALDEAYAEYCRSNPPTESECREALETTIKFFSFISDRLSVPHWGIFCFCLQ